MDPRYIEKIQEWVKLDNQLLRENILEFINQNKLEALTINISDGTIKFATQNSKSPLTIKSLKSILDKYNNEVSPINVDDLVKYINANMETKSRTYIKRDVK